MIGMDGQKSGGESKEDSLPLLSWAFCFFRLYALPFGMVRVAGFRMPQVGMVCFLCFLSLFADRDK